MILLQRNSIKNISLKNSRDIERLFWMAALVTDKNKLISFSSPEKCSYWRMHFAQYDDSTWSSNWSIWKSIWSTTSSDESCTRRSGKYPTCDIFILKCEITRITANQYLVKVNSKHRITKFIYLFKVNNGNTKTIREIYSMLTVNTLEWCHWHIV